MLKESICRLVGVLKHPGVGPSLWGFSGQLVGQPTLRPCLWPMWPEGGLVARLGGLRVLGHPKAPGQQTPQQGIWSRTSCRGGGDSCFLSPEARLCANNCRNTEMRKD